MKVKIVIIFFFISNYFFSQEKIVIKGKIVDSATKEILIGVSVFNKTKTIGTVSNLEGLFSISLPKKENLFFSFLGYSTKEVIIKDNKKIVVELVQESNLLDEVIIIAKKNINDIDTRKPTSSIQEIKTASISNRPTVNPIESIQGQVAGLSIKTTGELGKPVKIRIRGASTLPLKRFNSNRTSIIKELNSINRSDTKLSKEEISIIDNVANQPLYVLDGQIISPKVFQILNVNDIENIKVLKDASASALYGVKASNGVIEITSKRGINGKTRYSFSFNQGITFKGKPSQLMMRTKEKLNFELLSENKNTPGYKFSEKYIRLKNPDTINLKTLISQGKHKLDSIKKIETNWFNELSRINTYQSYNLSSSGGSDKSKFFISGNFTKHGGKFDGNTINRFSGRLNYEHTIMKKTYIMFNSNLGFSTNITPNSSDYSPVDLMYKLNPYEQKNKGTLISFPNRTFKNLVNQYSKKEKSSRFNFSTNITSILAKNLNISSVIGIDYLATEALAIVPPNAYSETSINFVKPKLRGKATKTKNINKNITNNTRINYNITINSHKIFLSANSDFFKTSNDLIGISGYGLPSKLLSGAGINNDIIGNRRSKTYSSKTSNATLGFGFSALYNWKNKFDFYSSYKLDGSSLLPSNKRWNTFWASGISYSLDKEQFLKNVKWLSSFKLRANYGKTASLAGISASLAVPTFGYGKNNYLGIRDFYLKDLYNKDLRPEKTTSFNIGLGLTIFNDFYINLDIYKRTTKDMLLTVPIAPSNGFTQQLKNVGVMENKGIEITFNAPIFKTDNFIWNSSFNLSYNNNKVIDLYAGSTLSISQNPYPDYEEGKPSDIIYGLIFLGINPADGKPLFQNSKGNSFDGTYTKPSKEDFYVLGYSTPPIFGGFNHVITYKNFSLSFNLYYNLGGKKVFTNGTNTLSYDDSNKNLIKGQLEKTWFKIGDENKKYPSLFLTGNNYYENKSYANTKNVGSTDFIRLNNIMFNYNFNKSYLNKIAGNKISSIRVFTQLNNIYTWSNFKGGDPESGNIQGSSQPIFSLGANINF